ncbi:MFS transporter [Candidatus Nomurabacteria bacterium]|nr:MFS transporter [Candidatus Nomurabacteria bacterium]
MKQTLRLFVALRFLESMAFSVIGTILVIYMMRHGLSLLEVSMVEMGFAVPMLLLQIPTGIMADIFGRKNMYVLSCGLGFIGCVVYTLSDSFMGFLLAEVVLAFSLASASGAFEGWLLARLDSQGYTGTHLELFSLGGRYTQLGILVGGLLGGLLAQFDIRYPWYFTCILFFCITVIAALYMKEDFIPPLVRRSVRETTMEILSGARQHFKVSVSIRRVIAIDALLWCTLQAPNRYWQPMFHDHHQISLAGLGLLKVGIGLALFAGNELMSRSRQGSCFYRRLLMVLIGIGVCLTLVAMNLGFYWVLIMFLGHEVFRGMYNPLRNAYLNADMDHDKRATLLSVVSMVAFSFDCLGLIVFGVVAQRYGIYAALALSGVVLILIPLFMLKKHNPT